MHHFESLQTVWDVIEVDTPSSPRHYPFTLFYALAGKPEPHLELEHTMKKLSLRLESLDVQSFDTSMLPSSPAGTVYGAEAGKEGSFTSAINVTNCSCRFTECQWTA